MEIVYKNNKVKNQIAKIAISNVVAQRRLRQLGSAPCFSDIPSSAKAHFLRGDLREYFAVDFDYPARIICEPVGEFKKEGGQFIKKSITALEIIKIEKDYH